MSHTLAAGSIANAGCSQAPSAGHSFVQIDMRAQTHQHLNPHPQKWQTHRITHGSCFNNSLDKIAPQKNKKHTKNDFLKNI